MKCEHCNGTGKSKEITNWLDFNFTNQEPIIVEVDCPECNGNGEVDEDSKS